MNAGQHVLKTCCRLDAMWYFEVPGFDPKCKSRSDCVVQRHGHNNKINLNDSGNDSDNENENENENENDNENENENGQ